MKILKVFWKIIKNFTSYSEFIKNITASLKVLWKATKYSEIFKIFGNYVKYFKYILKILKLFWKFLICYEIFKVIMNYFKNIM